MSFSFIEDCLLPLYFKTVTTFQKTFRVNLFGKKLKVELQLTFVFTKLSGTSSKNWVSALGKMALGGVSAEDCKVVR